VGGGSNAAGTIYHFVDNPEVQIVLAEAGGKGIDSGESAATIQLGRMGIIHGAKTLVMQSEDGQIEEPYSISAGLDYPGIGPFHANLSATKRALILAVDDQEALDAAFELTRLEGIIRRWNRLMPWVLCPSFLLNLPMWWCLRFRGAATRIWILTLIR